MRQGKVGSSYTLSRRISAFVINIAVLALIFVIVLYLAYLWVSLRPQIGNLLVAHTLGLLSTHSPTFPYAFFPPYAAKRHC